MKQQNKKLIARAEFSIKISILCPETG